MDVPTSLSSFVQQRSTSFWLAAALATAITYFVSRAIYLLYFHPYAKFPGPKIAAITDAWFVYHWLTGRYPWTIENVLKKYGDVVRIAPNEVVFFTAQALNDIVMSGTKGKPTFIKTEHYFVFGKHAGIASERDPDVHRSVRKALSPAFSPRAIRDQDVVLHRIVDAAIDKLERRGIAGQGANMSDWFDYIALDIAGLVTYGHDFENVKKEKASMLLDFFNSVNLWGTLNQTFSRFPLIYPLVFLLLPLTFARKLPWLLHEARSVMQSRVDRYDKLEREDYMSCLVSKDKQVPDIDWLTQHANQLILGGLDPVPNLYTSGVLFLLQNPEKLLKLQNEIRSSFSSYEDINDETLKYLPWLTAVINESLRLHTNGAFGMPRYSPGAMVDGHYIPKGCKVQTSIFAATHSERYWAKPRSFCPERWLSSDHPDYDVTFDNDARMTFKPFSAGTRSCIGQPIAGRQARLLFAKMIWRSDWELINGDEIKWEEDLRMYSIWKRPPVIVRFTPAKHAEAQAQVAET
ncbi:cytochrome P450 [Xylaria sp. FL0933]|nr:cytochrome P450 [Xylaria sp. FL0933]